MKPAFITELELLLTRFSYLDIDSGIASMGLIELWGVYCYLRRHADG
ncbi:MAG: hypothetical protein WA071_02230 [Undibacterium umbellatum]